MAEMDYHTKKTSLSNRIDDIMSDKTRIEGYKKSILNQITGKQLENQELDIKMEEQ